MKARSAAFRDNPISPRNLTLFWIEYVLRHPKTDLLRSATQQMSIFQILLLDVIIFLVSIVLTILVVFIYLIRKILNIFRKTKPKKKTS
ncbi:hypothetical protein O3M35_005542 [Rhynocoris fuscipes]|uniref:Glucuronosyltransferase n=1 Tax=Rhynocoris fuscipes TaxID=488301 RepID=A0AAW1DNY4_9HEMI